MASTANTLWSFEPVPFYAQKNGKLLCPCLKNPSSTDNIFKQLGRPQAHAWNWTAAWKQPGLKKNNNDIEFRRPKNKKKAKHKWLLVHGRETEATRYYAFHGFSVPQFQPTALYMLNMATDPEKRKLSSQKNTHVAPSCTHHRSNSPWTHTKPVSPHNQEAMSLPTQSSFQQTDFLVKFHLLTNPFDGK